MALITGTQNSKIITDVNKELLELRGELSDAEARVTLAKFLRNNIGFATELGLGVTLESYQELTIKSFFNRNYCMLVWGRGCAKSFCAAIYCILKCIFEPGTKILIASINFRTARRMFNEIEKFLASPEASLFRQCFGDKMKRNDQYEWIINGGSITAIPLTGEKIRGIRANVLILDEFLLLPPDIIDNVLMYGQVLEDTPPKKYVKTLQELNQKLYHHKVFFIRLVLKLPLEQLQLLKFVIGQPLMMKIF